jgi:hypothetical protein
MACSARSQKIGTSAARCDHPSASPPLTRIPAQDPATAARQRAGPQPAVPRAPATPPRTNAASSKIAGTRAQSRRSACFAGIPYCVRAACGPGRSARHLGSPVRHFAWLIAPYAVPPLTRMFCAVTQRAASLARNATTAAISSGPRGPAECAHRLQAGQELSALAGPVGFGLGGSGADRVHRYPAGTGLAAYSNQ